MKKTILLILMILGLSFAVVAQPACPNRQVVFDCVGLSEEVCENYAAPSFEYGFYECKWMGTYCSTYAPCLPEPTPNCVGTQPVTACADKTSEGMVACRDSYSVSGETSYQCDWDNSFCTESFECVLPEEESEVIPEVGKTGIIAIILFGAVAVGFLLKKK